MKSLVAIGFASLYGLAIRLMFGFFDEFIGVMSTTFLVLVPMIIGFLTVFLIPKEKNINGAGAFFLPWLSSALILVVTLLLNIEGAICWIMVFPFFAVLAGLGGLIGQLLRLRRKKNSGEQKSPWDTPNSANISILFALPVILGFAEGQHGLSKKIMIIEKEMVINAAPEKVWKNILNINDIEPRERNTPFSSWLGFPKHIRTTLDSLRVGGRRMAYYERGLYFTETISKFEENKLLVLDIKTDPKKIPPTVMDEHILIGGKHLDILEDAYELQKISDNKTKLVLKTRFFINTPFNWYSSLWADYLMMDILNGELDMIKVRAEQN